MSNLPLLLESELEVRDQGVSEFNSGTPARSWYHYLLILACIIFAAVSVGFVGTILWNSLPTWEHHAGTLLGRHRLAGAERTLRRVGHDRGHARDVNHRARRRRRDRTRDLDLNRLSHTASFPHRRGDVGRTPRRRAEHRVRPLGVARPRPLDVEHRQSMAQQLALRQRDLRQYRSRVRHITVAGINSAGGDDPADLRGHQPRGDFRRPSGPHRSQSLARGNAVAGNPRSGVAHGQRSVFSARRSWRSLGPRARPSRWLWWPAAWPTSQFHLLYPGTSIAAWIATEFGEAGATKSAALMALGELLMLMNFWLALVSRWLVSRST